MCKSIFHQFILCITIIFLMPTVSYAQKHKNEIDHFIVLENLLKNNKLAIVATDSLENHLEHVNGTFEFSLNGFNYPLKFNDGVAITPNKIEKSTLLVIKDLSEKGSKGQLYYIVKNDSGLNPIKISWLFLLLAPLVFILIVMMFRKSLLIGAIVLVLFLY